MNFDYSGYSYGTDFNIQRLLHRGQFSKTSLQFRVNKNHGESFIEDVQIDVQIDVQRRDTIYAELALLHRRYIGKAKGRLQPLVKYLPRRLEQTRSGKRSLARGRLQEGKSPSVLGERAGGERDDYRHGPQ